MTANEIYRSVLALMFMDDNDAAEYQKNFLVQLNMKLEECFETNNSVRIAKGKEAMEEPPMIESLEEEVPYEFELTRSVIPLGIAGDLYVDDDETGISSAIWHGRHRGCGRGFARRRCSYGEDFTKAGALY